MGEQLGRTTTEIPRLSTTAPPPAAIDASSTTDVQHASTAGHSTELPGLEDAAASKTTSASAAATAEPSLVALSQEAQQVAISPGSAGGTPFPVFWVNTTKILTEVCS